MPGNGVWALFGERREAIGSFWARNIIMAVLWSGNYGNGA